MFKPAYIVMGHYILDGDDFQGYLAHGKPLHLRYSAFLQHPVLWLPR